MSAALLALAVLLPAWAWSPLVLDDPRLDGALLSLAALAAVLAIRPARLLRGSGWWLAALALGLAPLLLAPDPPFWGGLADRAPLLAALALAAAAAARPAALERALPWMIAGVFLAAGYGLLQRLGLDPLGLRPGPESPPTAPLAGTNHGAELLLLALVTAAARPAGRGWARWLPLAALPVALHAGWLGVTAFRLGLPLGLGWAAWRDRSRLGVAGLILAAALTGEAARSLEEASAAAPAAAAAASPDWTSWQVRWSAHADVLGHSLRTPLGIGLGRFETDYPLWRSPETLRAASRGYTTPETPIHKDPHDEPLLLLIECGWLGLALGLAGAWRLLRRPGRPSWSAAPLVALAVPLLVRAPLSENPAALAFVALLVGATTATTDTGPTPTPTPARRRGRGWLLPLGLAVAAAAAAPVQLGGELALAGYRQDAASDRALVASLRWRPWDARAWSYLAEDRFLRQRPLAVVREAFLQALRHDPGDLHALGNLFTLEVEAGRPDAALEALARAEAIAPDHPAVLAKHAWISTTLPQMARDDFAAGRLEAGLAALRTAEGLGPDLAAVRALRGELYRATARRHRDAASALILEAAESDEFAAADNLRLRRHFLMAHLFEALALAREDQVEACRQSLQAAATYADSQHALVQRTARRLDLGEELVRVLLLRLDPQLQNWLGSAAGETAAEPEREAAEAADEEG